MDFADEGRKDVGFFEVEVVVGAVQVGWHNGQEVGAVLDVVAFTHLDAGNLRNGIGFVGVFQRAGEQVFFLHGLGAFSGINAGAA